MYKRQVLNGLAMICMALMLVPLMVMLLSLKTFAQVKVVGAETVSYTHLDVYKRQDQR